MSVIQTVREYELLDVLGGGGMGEVYRARHVLLDVPCAVKVVHPNLMQNAEIRARFVREAQTLQRLDHPNILRFITLFEDNGRLYLVTELLDGQPLDLCVTRDPDRMQRTDWFHQTVRGVAHAHRRSVLHRDLKPGNIQVLADGRVKILDFGIARPIAARALTATGHLVGTPVYLPPEVILGDTPSSTAGPTWDVFTLGLLACEMLTGRLPFDLDPNGPPLQLLNELSRLYAKKRPVADIRALAPDLSKGWQEAIERALNLDPAKRPADAGALLHLLDAAPALREMQTQLTVLSTRDLAPEDATGIHVIQTDPRSAPPAEPPRLPLEPFETGAAGATGVTRIARAREPEPAPAREVPPSAEQTQDIPRRRGPPAWVLPAVGAFAAGLAVALMFRGGGPVEPAAPAPASAVVVAAASVASEPVVEAPPSLALAPAAASEPVAAEVDAGILDFDPVQVGRPRAPRSAAARASTAPASAARRENAALPPGSSVGVLSVVATPPALVYVEDRYIGETPIKNRLLKPGRYEVKLVRNERPQPYKRTLVAEIRTGKRTELRYDDPAPRKR